MANYFMSDLSIRKGLKGIPCQMFGFLLTWTLYYLYRIISHQINNSEKPWFDKTNSSYYEDLTDES